MSNIVYLVTLVLLFCILCMPCNAAVGDTNCTIDANCTISNSKCNTTASKCQCLDNQYDNETTCQPRGDNGGDCTAGVANSCLYSGQLVCKEDNKCSCSDTSTHYWHPTSMTCETRGDNGGDCTSNIDNSCLYPGQLVCNSSNICSCSDTNTHYWHASSMKCETSGDYGGACTVGVAESCLYPGQLVCKSDNKCSCSDTSTHYWHSTSMSCKPRGANGGECTSSIDNSCLYPGQLVCNSGNKCSCNDTNTHYWDTTSMTCKPRGDNGGDCTSDANSCLYPGQLECNSGNECSCNDTSTYYWHATSMTCKPRGNNGGDCTAGLANSCLYPGHLVCNSGNTCSCNDTNTQYWDTTSMTCKTRGNNGGDCTLRVANSCLYPGQLVCKNDNKCFCNDTNTHYWHASSMTCTPRGNNGEDCTSDDNSCLYPGQLVCNSDNKCSCADTDTKYWHATSKTCKPRGNNGGDCTFGVANSCLYPEQLVCKNDKCSCNDTNTHYWHASSMTCKPKGNNGEECTFGVANSCLYPGQLVCKNDNKCSCNDTNTHYWDTTSTTCKLRGNNGQDCTSGVANSCLYPGQLVCKADNKCSCSDTDSNYWHATSMTCKPRGNNGGNCTSGVANSCLYPGQLVCKSDNKCSCSDTSTHYWHPTLMTCKTRGNNGGACTFGVANSCLYPGQLVCKNDNKCFCADTDNDYWHATSTTCKPKKSLGGDCDAAIECLVANSECSTKCQCQVNFYDTNNADSGGNCDPLQNLKVDTIELKTRSETYLVISWTAPQAVNAVEEYRFLVGGTLSEVSVGKQLEANVTGLTPGVMYNITVISVDSNSRPAVQKTSPAPVNQATMTAVPGPIDLTNSDLTASDGQITINWKSTGTVYSYTVTISELVINPALVYSPSYVIGGNAALRNGHRYTLTIKAKSNNIESAEYTEKFRTVITQPNPPLVVNFCKVEDRQSTSIYVRWQAPTVPNGDILYYLIDRESGPTPVPQLNTSTNVLVKKVESLLEERQYCFRVKAVNDGPDNIRTSVPSYEHQCCFTKAGLSTAPTSVIHSTTSRSIQISWSKPVDSKGAIIGYRLRVESNDVCVVEVLLECNTGCSNVMLQRQCLSANRLIRENRNSTELMSSMSYEIDQLLPYTDYKVWINAINAAGDGDRNETSVQTDSEVPQKPLSVVALVKGSHEITVSWNQRPPRPGVTSYYVEAYEVVLNADPKFVKFSNLTGFSPQTTTFSGLEAYWNYTFSVVAATNKGNSEQSEKSVTRTTHQDAPGAVLNLTVERPTNSFTQMNVSWRIPLLRDQNGVINKYTIEVFNDTGIITSTSVNATMDKLEKIFEITPEKNYNIKVYAVNTEGTKGEKVEKSYDAKPGPPNVPGIPALVEEIASPPSTQTTIKVKFSLDWFLNTDNGERTDGGIIVCPASSCDNYGEASDMKSPTHFATTLSTWKESKAVGFTIPYRVTSRTWIEDNRNTTSRRKRSNQEVELTIGEESGCDKLADDVYCNGPLPADIRILVIAFVCTSGGCTESKQFGPYKTQPEPEDLPIAIIAGAVSAVVVFLIVIIIIVVIKKQKGSRRNQPTKLEENEIDNFTNLNPHGLETPSVERKNIRKKRPIKLKDFEEKVAELHKDSNLKFAHEYEELKTLTDPKTLKNVSNSLAETEENKLKNRYVNILPYDHTIVKLLPLEDDDEQASTFINANYIPGYKSQREYIASQGPIPSTIDDFWRMVWEQSVSIIVMLTLAKEDGRIKCEMYWPTEQSEAKQFGDIVVEMQSCSTINTYEFRIFKMTLGDKSRTLKHFHFLNWKDFSANVQNDVMVDFISNVRSHVTIPESRVPMIVHCSAGVGRTGTFIALDHMMQFIRDHDFDSTIDIFDFVVKMRECRMYMVQTEQQYIFIHDCIKDILEKKRQKELEDGDGLYGNVDNDQDHNIYSNEAFDPEPELYQNFAIGQPKTEL